MISSLSVGLLSMATFMPWSSPANAVWIAFGLLMYEVLFPVGVSRIVADAALSPCGLLAHVPSVKAIVVSAVCLDGSDRSTINLVVGGV